MKTLLIVRHAKSSWDDVRLADHQRPLNDRGKKDAPMMAERLFELYPQIDKCFTSYANRAVSTARFFARKYAIDDKSIESTAFLYLCSESDWLHFVQRISDKHQRALIVGHNPALTGFVNWLANIQIENVPTCGIVCIEFAVERWEHLCFGQGNMRHFIFPKMFKTKFPEHGNDPSEL